MRSQEECELKSTITRRVSPKEGDLVLRRRFAVDKSLGMKLYAKWDGPYRLISISPVGTSGYIEDLKTGRILGRYAFNTLKVFVPREASLVYQLSDESEWSSFDHRLGVLRQPIPREVDLTVEACCFPRSQCVISKETRG